MPQTIPAPARQRLIFLKPLQQLCELGWPLGGDHLASLSSRSQPNPA
jgi:hypothetical protein